jgi:hypothetical protein
MASDVVVANSALVTDDMKPLPSEVASMIWADWLVNNFGYIWYRHRTLIAAHGAAYELVCNYGSTWTIRYELLVRYMDIWKTVKMSYGAYVITGTLSVRLRVILNGTDYTDIDHHTSSETGTLTVNLNHAPADNAKEKCYILIESRYTSHDFPSWIKDIVIYGNSE